MQKVAILGGGISSLVAALELSETPVLRQRYQITVYQLGWRLGGKGASSRNPAARNRIEEHGLHIWLGFYENAFEVMRRCYHQLNRPDGMKLRSWGEAFKPHDFVVLEEHINGQWIHWPFTFPRNDSQPGDGSEFPSVWSYVVEALNWVRDAFREYRSRRPLPNAATVSSKAPAIVHEILAGASQLDGEPLVHEAADRAAAMPLDPSLHLASDHFSIAALLEEFVSWLRECSLGALEADQELRRIYIPIDILCSTIKGIFADGVLFHGLDQLDAYDFREWIGKHGASQISLDSAWTRGAYDLAFSFVGGDSSRPNCAAGAAVRAMFHMVFGYKGSILWKMQAGMGETVFTPMYELLRRRGVRFEFFKRVDALRVADDGLSISAVEITNQATVTSGEYEPLVAIDGIDCWAHRPLYEQLAEGTELRESGENLESYWSAWPGVGSQVLRNGTDFDILVLGIPVAGLRDLCSELIARSSRWGDMLQEVKTIQTQGFQLWLSRDLPGVGWRLGSPVLGGYVEPLDTWADMSHLLSVEGWKPQDGVRQLAYFCGVMEDAPTIPGRSDHGFPGRESARAKQAAVAFLQDHVSHLWPEAVRGDPPSFDWNVLCAPAGAEGPARFDAQYWHPNIDPSERYTLAVAGSTKYRLAAHESGYANLVLTGDWIRNGLNTPGCIESAVISGKQAARVISGQPTQIIGEADKL